ncbi:MAG: tyrosine-protein phosphatase [Anaerovoracaceae bacterium]|nr:tyrosine-protein phosphatase [Anaerovoracaceae bacterium]
MELKIEGVYNIRDLGGLPAAGGMKVKTGKLIRSGELSAVTPAGIERLNRIGVSDIIDLRTINEVRELPDIDIPDTVYTHISMLEVPERGISHEGESSAPDTAQLFIDSVKQMNMDVPAAMNGMYDEILDSEYSGHAFRKFFDILLSAEGAALFHCTAGKDRTGICAIYVLGLLGVPRDIILDDCEMSDRCLRPQTEDIVSRVAKINDDPELLRQVRILNSVLPEYAENIFGRIDERGGIEKFLEERSGIGREEREELRRKLLGRR